MEWFDFDYSDFGNDTNAGAIEIPDIPADSGGSGYSVDWGKVTTDAFGRAIPAAIGAGITTYGNQRAANTIAGASNQAAAAMAERARIARETMRPIADRTAIGVDHLRNIVAAPQQLTPAQQIAMQDAQRNAHRTVTAGPLRGSGRATAAVLNDVTNRTHAGFLEANRARADNAAGVLAGQNLAANTTMAGQDVNLGVQLGGQINKAGEAQAGATTANAKVLGDTFGKIVTPDPQITDVMSLIRGISADERKGRYSDANMESV